jgi:heterodisulfide reductase subunit A
MGAEVSNNNYATNQNSTIRIGITICNCGGDIANILNTDVLREKAANLTGVIHSTCESYPCSKDGRTRLHQTIIDHKLDRVLIAGCAPRLVEKLFQQTVEEAGLNCNYLDITDIREHCAYVHGNEPAAAMQKAANLIEMGVGRLAAISPPRTFTRDIVGSALVIGSGLAGLTSAYSLANSGIDITVIESTNELGGGFQHMQERAQELITEQVEKVTSHPHIETLLNSRVTEVTGQPGNYTVHITHGDKTSEKSVGAIVVATGARPKGFRTNRWFDRSVVMTQAEFGIELSAAIKAGASMELNDIVMILNAEDSEGYHGSRIYYTTAIEQAIRIKQIAPDANLSILFQDLFLREARGVGDSQLSQARELGVNFYRYHKDHSPAIGRETVDIDDLMTHKSMKIPFDRLVLATPLLPQNSTNALAAMLKLPQDANGFMIERRARLRPEYLTDDGIYVVGGAHQPCDVEEELFQAHVASARILRFLSGEVRVIETPVVEIDDSLCTGCGNCVQACPWSAVRMTKRDGLLSLAEVEVFRCVGCGNCVVVCPVRAITLPMWSDQLILAQIHAALDPTETKVDNEGATHKVRRIIVFACEWSAYAAADMAGIHRLPYPPDVRLIRLNCTARFDPHHVLWAFLNGADGVFLGACLRGECHYGNGNQYAEERVTVLKKQLSEYGIDSSRLRLEFFTADNGHAFAKSMNEFASKVSKQKAR